MEVAMKRAMTLALALLLLATGGCRANTPAAPTPGVTAALSPTPQAPAADIGFSLAGSDAFRAQLKSDIESQCAATGYTAEILSAETAEAQQEDIRALLAMGVTVMVIDPVDIDMLETVLAECETQHVRVINIVNAINGRVDTLISPDYRKAGEAAADYANALADTGRCLELKTECDSFVMQLLSDGFEGALESGVGFDEAYCGSDEQAACAAAKEALQAGDVGFIFAQNAALGRGALQAIRDTASGAPLVVFDGSMETVASVASGEIYAAVFFGPGEAARLSVYYADQIIKNGSFQAPQYVELTVETVDADNAAQYRTDAAYAQTKES
jgi:ABC-type sugar transport system substrate-binding protein